MASDPPAALRDFERALALNPRSRDGLENKAHVLSERLGRTQDGLKTLDDAVTLYPEDGPARARGTLLARLGRRGDALADAAGVLAAGPTPALVYQVAGIYAQTRGNNRPTPRSPWSCFPPHSDGDTDTM